MIGQLTPLQFETGSGTRQLVYVLLAGYVLLMVYLAYLGWKVNKEGDDMLTFTLARGYLGPIMLGAAFAATWSSAVIFMGVPGFGTSAGMSVFWHSWPFWFTGVVVMILIAAVFRKMGTEMGSLSLPEWIADRYDNYGLSILFAFILLANTAYVAGQFAGLAILFDTIVGLDYTTGVLIALVGVIAYVAIGGTYTDVLSDYIQAIFMSIVGLSIISVVLFVYGPFEIAAQLNSMDPMLSAPTSDFPIFSGPAQVFGVFFFAFALGFQPQLMNKYLSLRSQRDIKLFILSAAVVHTLVYFIVWNGPLALILFDELPGADYATPAVVIEVFPPILVALFGVAIISAAISTTDGLVVSIGTAIGNDAYRKYHEENTTGELSDRIERRSVWIARGTIIVVGLVAAWMALQQPAFLAILAITGIFAFISASTPVVIGGMVWDGSTALGAYAAGIVGPIAMILWQYDIFFTGIASLYLMGTVATILAGIAFTVVSAVDPTPPPAEMAEPAD
jgi:Na+/proline symporter